MRHLFTTCLCFLLLCPSLGFADEGKTIHALIAATLKPGERMGKLQVADMCGGKAVVMNEYAEYWVIQGTVTAANGIAQGYSPKVFLSPPSINHNTVQQAMAGEDIPPQPHLGQSYIMFLVNVLKKAKALGLPPIKKDGYLGVVMKLPNGMKATVSTEESCGLLTKVTVLSDYVVDSKDNAKTMALSMLIVPQVLAPDMPDQERQDILDKAMQQTAKKKGEYTKFTLGNAQCQLIYLPDGKKKGRFALEAVVTK